MNALAKGPGSTIQHSWRSFLFVCLLVAGSCTQQNHRLLDREKFVEVYAALLEERSAHPDARLDTALTPGARDVLVHHGVSEEQFRETFKEYNRNVETWKGVYDAVITTLEGKARAPQKQRGQSGR